MKNSTKLFMILILGLYLIGCSLPLKPAPFIPQRCTMPAGVACIDQSAKASGSLDVVMQNGMGNPISNVILNIGGVCEPKGVTIDINKNQKFTCKIPAGISDSKYESGIQMTYIDQNGQSKSLQGKIVGKYD